MIELPIRPSWPQLLTPRQADELAYADVLFDTRDDEVWRRYTSERIGYEQYSRCLLRIAKKHRAVFDRVMGGVGL